MSSFGEMLRRQRRAVGLTLRAFAADTQLDPAYVSRIERGVIPPPKDGEALDRLAEAVGLVPGTEDWIVFKDAAAIDAGRLPADIASDDELLKKLPILFRTARGERLSRDELAKFVDFMKDK